MAKQPHELVKITVTSRDRYWLKAFAAAEQKTMTEVMTYICALMDNGTWTESEMAKAKEQYALSVGAK